jgi:tetratricopeptide (TPR) repeat protein
LKKTEENGKLNTADNLLRENKNEDAIVFLDEAIALNPQNALSYYMRGMAYLALNQYPKALLDYTKSISLDPQNAKYYSMRGLYYNNRGEYQKAKSDFIQAGKLFKNKGDIENYNIANKNLKITEQNIAFKATQEASKKRTRELLVKRACLTGKQGYTDGEIGNEIYRLVRINTPAPRRTASSISPYSNSIGRQFAEIFDNLFENLNNVDMQDKTSDIMQVAKKRCKF